MPSLHPKNIALKNQKCPDCKEKLEVANLQVMDGLVKAGCHGENCNYTIDLFWLPSGKPGMN